MYKLKTYSFLLVAILIVLISSCEKEIKVKLPDYKEKLVVEASIETGMPAIVFLSVTAPYFGNVSLSDPTQFFVKGAFVTVTDGFQIDTLKEIDPSKGYFYIGTKVFGQVGQTYHLTINVNGNNYNGITTILNPIPLDSIYFKEESDSLGFMWGHLTEPAGSGNCYRWFAKRYERDLFYAAPMNSAFDDKFIDGKSFDFAYERPAQPNQQQINNDDVERGYYRVGDTVVVKFCTIGRNELEFWQSYYSNKMSNGNPFSAPTNIQSTITGGDAIGAFCGYSPSFDTIIIKKPK